MKLKNKLEVKSEIMVNHKCTKETEIALMRNDIDNIKVKIDEIHKAIVGNGKKGIAEKVANLEGGLKMSQYFIGAVMLVITLINLIK